MVNAVGASLRNPYHYDISGVDLGKKLRVADFSRGLRSRIAALDDLPQQSSGDQDHQPEYDGFDCAIREELQPEKSKPSHLSAKSPSTKSSVSY